MSLNLNRIQQKKEKKVLTRVRKQERGASGQEEERGGGRWVIRRDKEIPLVLRRKKILQHFLEDNHTKNRF